MCIILKIIKNNRYMEGMTMSNINQSSNIRKIMLDKVKFKSDDIEKINNNVYRTQELLVYVNSQLPTT